MERVIVTGCTGAVGLALVNELIAHGIQVVAILRPESKRSQRLPISDLIEKIEIPLERITDLSKILKGKIDCFYHLGWDYSRAHFDVEKQYRNIGYTVKAVIATAELGCPRFIGAGSQAEFGPTNAKLSANTSTFPIMPYGIAKLCAGQLSREMCKQLGVEHIWTRIISIYGPGDAESTLIMSLIRKMLNGETVNLTKGEQMWDFLYAKDCARALRMLGDKGINGKIYCIGYGKMYPLKEFIRVLRDIIDPSYTMNFGAIPYSNNQIMRLDVDISELSNDTGFTPMYSFAEGINETVEWCKRNVPILKSEEML